MLTCFTIYYCFKSNCVCRKTVISESGRLISDIIEICGNENIPKFLVTMDLEKTFDSLDQNFLLCVLKKTGFGDNFITWIKILNDHQSCVINGGLATQYFTLKKVHAKMILYKHIFLLLL